MLAAGLWGCIDGQETSGLSNPDLDLSGFPGIIKWLCSFISNLKDIMGSGTNIHSRKLYECVLALQPAQHSGMALLSTAGQGVTASQNPARAMTGPTTFEVTKDSRRRLAAVKAKDGIIAFVVLRAGVSRTGVHIRGVRAQGRRAIALWGCATGAATPACGRVAGMWRRVHLVLKLQIWGGGRA